MKKLFLFTAMMGTIFSNVQANEFITYNKRQIVFDETTGLTWSDEKIKKGTYNTAESYCRDLNLGGLQGWRLHTVEERAFRISKSSFWRSLQ